MSGRYYGVGDDHFRDEHESEHISMPEIHNPADNQPLYDPPLDPDRSASAAPHRRGSTYSQYSPAVEHPASGGHEYPGQAYTMPYWPEDDIYRLGTPASGMVCLVALTHIRAFMCGPLINTEGCA